MIATEYGRVGSRGAINTSPRSTSQDSSRKAWSFKDPPVKQARHLSHAPQAAQRSLAEAHKAGASWLAFPLWLAEEWGFRKQVGPAPKRGEMVRYTADGSKSHRQLRSGLLSSIFRRPDHPNLREMSRRRSSNHDAQQHRLLKAHNRWAPGR
jgi:hypothetical protein